MLSLRLIAVLCCAGIVSSTAPVWAKRVTARTTRTDLVLVIDKSGSMHGKKLLLAKQLAISLVKGLKRRDRVAVVTFDSSARLVLKLSRHVHAIKAVQGIRAGGGTDVGEALRLAMIQLGFHKKPALRRQHILLLADGMSSRVQLPQLVAKHRRAGITLSTVAIGHSVDYQLLRKLASIGGGQAHRLSMFSQLRSIVRGELKYLGR